MNDVILYSKPYCPYCDAAKALLASKGIAPKVIDVSTDFALLRAMMDKTGQRTVPQIFIGETHVGGYDDLSALEKENKLDELLKAQPK
jgi:glutaredoxin 3